MLEHCLSPVAEGLDLSFSLSMPLLRLGGNHNHFVAVGNSANLLLETALDGLSLVMAF